MPKSVCSKKRRRMVQKRVLLVLMFVLILGYIVFQVYAVVTKDVKTEPAGNMVLKDTIDAKCMVIRDEKTLCYEEPGVLSFLVDDGDRISNNGLIATVYKSNEDKKVKSDILKIDKEIQRLNELNSRVSSLSVTSEALNKRIFQNLNELLRETNNKNYSDTESIKNDILYLIDTKQMMAGNITDCSDKISTLTAEKNTLIAKSGESIGEFRSSQSGYFTGTVDGYENLFKYDEAMSLSADSIKSMMNQKPEERSENVVGKLINNPIWYLVSIVPTKKAEKLSVGQPVTIEMPFAFSESVPCEVVSINLSENGGDSAVIFSCNRMNKELLLIRNEEIRINVNEYKGIGFKKSALHQNVLTKEVTDEKGNKNSIEKKVMGVYVLYGNYLIFKEVKTIHISDTYVVCDPVPLEGEIFKNETIKPFDEIVVSGTNLYSGKVVKS